MTMTLVGLWSNFLLLIGAGGAGWPAPPCAALLPPDRGGRLGRRRSPALADCSALTIGWFAYGRRPAGHRGTELNWPWVPGLGPALPPRRGRHLLPAGRADRAADAALLRLHVLAGAATGGRGGRSLVALLLVIEVGILGTFLALDLVLFFIFFEVVLLPMYAVIAGLGRRRRAGGRPASSCSTRCSARCCCWSASSRGGRRRRHRRPGGADRRRRAVAAAPSCAAFTLLAVAFAVKSPLWPLHTWLPDAHTEAPTVGSVILAGVLLKMGTYGLIRVASAWRRRAPRGPRPVLGVLAVAAIIVGSLVCLAQTELKRLIAYSSRRATWASCCSASPR